MPAAEHGIVQRRLGRGGGEPLLQSFIGRCNERMLVRYVEALDRLGGDDVLATGGTLGRTHGVMLSGASRSPRQARGIITNKPPVSGSAPNSTAPRTVDRFSHAAATSWHRTMTGMLK